MRNVLAVLLLSFGVSASATVVTTGTRNIRSERDILGCADVRAFGAVGNGVADDTAAIQAAINSSSGGGPVCLPPGIFKITSTVTLKAQSSIYGAGGSSAYANAAADAATVIDARTIGNTTALARYAGNSVGIKMQGFNLWGPAGNSTSIGIDLSYGRDFKIEDVGVVGFRWGFYVVSSQGGVLLHCATQLQGWTGQPAAGLLISGSHDITVLGGNYANASGYNIQINTDSTRILILAAGIDEAFNSGSVKAAPILVQGANDVRIQGPRIYYAHGGYGIRLGDGTSNPTNVTLRDITIQRFSASAPPLAGIEVRGSGHVLDNVVVNVDPDGGTTTVSDLASDTKWYRVTGVTTGTVTAYTAIRDPGMRTSYPGTGSKAVWADPTAATTNVLRFAP